MNLTQTGFRVKDVLAYAAVLAMFGGLVLSRTVYSIGLLFIAIYWITDFRVSLPLWKKPWFLAMLAMALVVPVVDVIQGAGVDKVFFIKLSLPLFPLFFFTFRPDAKKLIYLAYVVMAVLFVTACHSLWQYYVSFEESNKGYGEARVMQVGLYSDHIRISVAMALSTVMAWHACMINSKRWHKVMVYGYILFQLTYLHILTARTGLVVLYIGLLVLALAYIAQYGKKYIPLGIGILMLMPVLAYWFIPTFYNRVGFARYDFGYYSKQEYRQGSSDGFRYYSILSGIEAFRSEPVTGVGFKGLHEVNGQWFRTRYPEIRDEEIIQPSSALVLHAAAAGILGLLVFLSFALLPLMERSLWGNRYFLAIYAALSATWLFEILPENQYGIFVVGFFLSWAWWVAESSRLVKKERNN